MNIYEQWIADGKPFMEGILLLSTNQKGKVLAANIGRKENAWNADKLAYELSKMDKHGAFNGMPAVDRGKVSKGNKGSKQVIGEPNEANTAYEFFTTKKKHKYAKTDDETVKALEKERDILYREMALHHGKLDVVKKDEREKAAFRILELADLLSLIYEKLDYYEANGKLPEVVEKTATEDLSGVALMKKKNSLDSYISKHKKDKTKQVQVEKKKAELAEVKKALAALDGVAKS